MSSSSHIRRAVRQALVMSAMTAAASLPAMAQDQPAAADTITTVTVTGSRIPQPQIEAVSPVTSVSEEEIKQTGTTRIEDLLNTLPQVAGDYGSGVSNGATGEATISLRNLGANRTLVLVNGRRLMPGDPTQNGNAAPDLNQIPVSLVERVDVLTGGASATYGADAVAGVVNFVMNDHFEGVRLDGNFNFYNHHNRNAGAEAAVNAAGFTLPPSHVNDGYSREGTIIVGSNFADGKGNATAYFGYRRDAAVLQGRRDFSACSLTTTSCGGSVTANPAVFSTKGSSTLKSQFGSFAQLQSDNTLGPLNALYNYAPLNYFQRPDERYTAGVFAHYDINDHARAYMEFSFMDDRSTAQIAGSGAFYGSGTGSLNGVPDASWVVNCNNPYLGSAADANSILSQYCGGVADPTKSAHLTFGRRNTEGAPRSDDLQHTSYREVVGLKGDITDGFTYDIYGLTGTTKLSEMYSNDVSKSRLSNALQAVTDPLTGNVVCKANSGGTIGAPGCVPYNIFQIGGVTQAAVNYIQVPGLSEGQTTERVVDGSVTGDLGKYGVKSPFANDGLGVNIGSEWRSEHSELHPDQEFITNDLAGQGAPTLPTVGGFNVWELYLEGRMPLIEDAPFAKSLTLEAGYRYSSYNLAFGTTNTYKFGTQWAPTADVRLRLGYNRAVRAPNIQELFLQPRVQLDGVTDPCAGAAPSASLAQCELSGVTPAEYGNIVSNPSKQYNGLVGGNTNLKPETADTYTAGIVFTPTFVPDLSVTVDYYNIHIKDVITTLGSDFVLAQCLGGVTSYCGQITRTPATGSAADGSLWIGTGGYIDDFTLNLGGQTAVGIDLTLDYKLDLATFGKLNFDFVGNYVTKFATQSLPGGPSYDCVGYYGATCGVAEPHWKHKFRATWNTPIPAFDVNMTWRHIGGVTADVASPDPGLAGDTTPTPGLNLGHRDYIDVGASYTLDSKYTLRVGMNNVFDKDPPLANASYLPTVFGNGNTLPQVYDTLGRFIFVNVTLDF
jgi:iron complex outermembrane receptor protein